MGWVDQGGAMTMCLFSIMTRPQERGEGRQTQSISATPMRSPLLLFAVALTACSQQNVAPVTAPVYSLEQAADSVPLYMNRETRVGTLWLTLFDVTDSRCPTGVVCVWEGDATAFIQADPPCIKEGCKAASLRMELHTRLEPKSRDYFGYRVRLVGVAPYPAASSPTDKARYVAWVRVTPQS